MKAQEAEKLKSSESAAFLAIASPAGDLKEEEQTVKKPQDLKNRWNGYHDDMNDMEYVGKGDWYEVCSNPGFNPINSMEDSPKRLNIVTGLWSISPTYPTDSTRKLCAPFSDSLALSPTSDWAGGEFKWNICFNKCNISLGHLDQIQHID